MRTMFAIASVLMSASIAIAGDNPNRGNAGADDGPRNSLGYERSSRNQDGGDREHGGFAPALHQQQQDIRDRNDPDLRNLGQWLTYICGEDGAQACGSS